MWAEEHLMKASVILEGILHVISDGMKSFDSDQKPFIGRHDIFHCHCL